MNLPKFWYDGSKKWGIASDLTFIVERLNRLSYENQKSQVSNTTTYSSSTSTRAK